MSSVVNADRSPAFGTTRVDIGVVLSAKADAVLNGCSNSVRSCCHAITETWEETWGHCAGLKMRCDFAQIVRITGFYLF